MTMATKLSFIKNQNGAAGAEMALMLPLLLVLMFGPFELANYFWTEHKVVKGVRDGARYAARLNFSNFECGADICDADIETTIKNVTLSGSIDGGTPNIADWDADDIDVQVLTRDEALDGSGDSAITTGIYRGMPNAPIVQVTTTFTYGPLFEALGFDATDITVSASSESAVMGI